ncbi:hypothetical protein Hamer_G009538 [Homarus americanus]|uniref:Mutator-like transposase domain-containing protein n=2 Tax=Homarus americanus TaxID=6706 RepID=A0A8J5N2Q7_HOMAM|nr:hypothetical protein Hamer_G009538 [Homarus americanus]
MDGITARRKAKVAAHEAIKKQADVTGEREAYQLHGVARRKTVLEVQEAGTEMITRKANVLLDAEVLESTLGMLKCDDCNGSVKVLVKPVCVDTVVSVTCVDCNKIVLEIKPKLMNVNKTEKEKDIYENNLSLVLTLASRDVSYREFFDAAESMKIRGLSYKSWLKHLRYIHNALLKKCDVMFLKARSAVQMIYGEIGRHPDTDGILNIDVSYESAWLDQGPERYYGVGVVIELYTGIVLDWEFVSSYCHECKEKKEDEVQGSYDEWKRSHERNCNMNYKGDSDGREEAVVQRMCSRSVERYQVRYVVFITERDSNACDKIMQMNNGQGPYGAKHAVVKEESVSHLRKELGAALYKVRDEMIKMKCPELTKEVIGNIQSHCEMSVRQNLGKSRKDMKRAIFSSYFHCTAVDDTPDRHQFCPQGPDSLCFWQKARARNQTPPPHREANMFTNFFDLTDEIKDKITHIYGRLADDDYLIHCRLVNTLTSNKTLLGWVWHRCGRERYRRLEMLQFATALTCLEWNMGYTEGGLHKELGLKYTPHTARMKEVMERSSVTRYQKKKCIQKETLLSSDELQTDDASSKSEATM